MKKGFDWMHLFGWASFLGGSASLGSDMVGAAKTAAQEEMQQELIMRIVGAVVAFFVALWVCAWDYKDGTPMITSWLVYWISVLVATVIGFIAPGLVLFVTVGAGICALCCN